MLRVLCCVCVCVVVFFQAEDGIRDLVRSRGLGDVYKRQRRFALLAARRFARRLWRDRRRVERRRRPRFLAPGGACLLYTSDAADERSSVDLGGRRILKKKKSTESHWRAH